MTREEFVEANMPARAMGGGVPEAILSRRWAVAVQNAMARGDRPPADKVLLADEIIGPGRSAYPPEILADYPDLKPQPPGESAASQQESQDEEGNKGRQGRQEGLLNETPATPEGTRGDSVSITFARIPPKAVRDRIKAAGFTFNRDTRAWEAPDTEANRAAAAQFEDERKAALEARGTPAKAIPKESSNRQVITKPAGPDKRIGTLRNVAEALRAQANKKRDSTYFSGARTARQARIGESIGDDARRMDAMADQAEAIADAIEAGTLPEILSGITNRAQLETLRFRGYPEPYVNAHNLREALDKIAGRKGAVKINNKLGRYRHAENIRLYDESERDAIRQLQKMTESKYLLGGVQEFERMLKIGIRTPDDFAAAKKALQSLRGGAPTQASEQENRLAVLMRSLIGQKVGMDFFPTPAPVVQQVISAAEIGENMRVLEPSAGAGHLADEARTAAPGVSVDVLEVSSQLREILEAKGHGVVEFDFEDYNPGPVYDRIVMNPPFSGGKDIEHVRRAFDMLKPGGRLVAIMSEGPFFRSDKKAEEFREWLEENVGESEQLPAGSFKTSYPGLPTTGVAARMVTIDKPAGTSQPEPAPEPERPAAPGLSPEDQRDAARASRLREFADKKVAQAEALERNSSRRFDNAPGAFVTGGSGRRRSGLHKKTNQAIEGSLEDLRKAKALREAAGKLRSRADHFDPAKKAERAEREAKREEARQRLKAQESAVRKAAPIINEDSPGILRMTKAEWAKTSKDFKGIAVRGDVRVREVVHDSTLQPVFITDMPVRNRPAPAPEPSATERNTAQQSENETTINLDDWPDASIDTLLRDRNTAAIAVVSYQGEDTILSIRRAGSTGSGFRQLTIRSKGEGHQVLMKYLDSSHTIRGVMRNAAEHYLHKGATIAPYKAPEPKAKGPPVLSESLVRKAFQGLDVRSIRAQGDEVLVRLVRPKQDAKLANERAQRLKDQGFEVRYTEDSIVVRSTAPKIETAVIRKALREEIKKRKGPALWVDEQLILPDGKYEFNGQRFSKVSDLSQRGFEKNLRDVAQETDHGFQISTEWFGMNEAAADVVRAWRGRQLETEASRAKEAEAAKERERVAAERYADLRAHIDDLVSKAKWKKASAVVPTIDEQGQKTTRTVEGTEYKGVIVHKTVNGSTWALTHIKSGKGLTTPFGRRADARVAAVRMAEMADFTLSEEELSKTADYELLGKVSRGVHSSGVYEDFGEKLPPRKTTLEKVEEFADKIETEARERIKGYQIPRGDRSGAALPPQIYADLVIVGAARILKGGVGFARWAKGMTDTYGAVVKGSIRALYRDSFAVSQVLSGGNPFQLQDPMSVVPKPTTGAVKVRKGLASENPEARKILEAWLSGQKEGIRETRAAYREQMKTARAAWKAEAKIARAAIRAANRDDLAAYESVRKQIVDWAQEHLPRSEQWAVLRLAATAKRSHGLHRALWAIDLGMARYDYKQAVVRYKVLSRAQTARKLSTNEARDKERDLLQRATQTLYEQGMTRKGPRRRQRTLKSPGAYRNVVETATTIMDELAELRAIDRLETRALGKHKRNTLATLSRQAVRNVERSPTKVKDEGDLGDVAQSLAGRTADLFSDAATLTRKAEGVWNDKGVLSRLIDARPKRRDSERLLFVRGVVAELDRLARDAGFDSLSDARIQSSPLMGKTNMRFETVTLGGSPRRIPLGGIIEILAMDRDTLGEIVDGSPLQFAGGTYRQPVKVTLREINAIRTKYRDKYGALVQGVKRGIIEGQVQAPMFKAVRRIKGAEPDAVSGYFPRKRNTRLSPNRGVPQSWGDLATAYAENAGITKERTGGKTPIVVGSFFDTVIDHVDEASKIIYLAEPIRDAASVLFRPEVQTAISERHGASMVRDLTAHLLAASQTQAVSQGGPDRAFRFLMRNLSLADLTLNPGTWLKQLGGAFRLASYFPRESFGAGLKAMTDGSLDERMYAHSGYLWARYHADPFTRYTPVVGGAMAFSENMHAVNFKRALKGGLSAAKAKDAKGAYAAWVAFWNNVQVLNWFDRLNARIAFGAAVHEIQANNPGMDPAEVDKRAAARAERAVRETQNSSGAADHSTLLANESNKATAARLMLMYASDRLKAYSRVKQAWKRSPRDGAIATLLEAANIAWAAAVTQLIGSNMIDWLFGGDDDGPEKMAADFGLDVAGDAARVLFPPLGPVADVAQSMARGWEPQPFSMNVLDAGNDIAKNFVRSAKDLMQFIENGDTSELVQMAQRLNESSRILGNPGVPIVRKVLRAIRGTLD